jgi:succinate dehydrogenase / fumarate reductase cytochrome b subunit
MNIFNLFLSSVGKKILMALSGILMIMFVIVHLLGNLGIFKGQDVFNNYALFLHSMPTLIWIARVSLLSIVALHIYLSISLNLQNKKANSLQYKTKAYVKTSLQSRTMMIGGVTILLFIVYHLFHFTINGTDVLDSKGRLDVYGMVITGFQNVYTVTFYVFAQFCLCLHLSHGFFSAAQTLGITQGISAKVLKTCANIIPTTIFILYSSIPIGVLLGIINCA